MKLRPLVLSVLLLSFLAIVPAAYGADPLSKWRPYVSVMEEYTDNVDLKPDDRKKEDFITTVQPGIKYSNMGQTAGVDLDPHDPPVRETYPVGGWARVPLTLVPREAPRSRA